MRIVTVLLLAIWFFASPFDAFGQAPKKDEPLPEKVSYYKDVRPIFQQLCQGCHQPAKAQGGYVMTSHADLLKKTDHELPGVIPGQPEKSAVYQQITPRNGKPPAMPRNKDPLTDRQLALVKLWIEQGAKDDTPASARAVVVDMDHPPVYLAPPVIPGLAFSPDSTLLAVAGYHEVVLHKSDGTGIVGRLVGLSERVQSVAFSPDGKLIAVTGGDPGRFGEVQIWDVKNKRLRLSLPVTYDTVYGASWSPDGKLVAFGCSDNSVRAVEADTGKQVLFQGGHNDWVLDTVFSKNGEHLVSVGRDRTMKLTEVATQRLIDNISSITPGALKGGLMAVDRHPEKDELLIGGADGVPKIYRMFRVKDRKIGDDFNRLRTFPSFPGRIFAVKYGPGGKRILVGSSGDGTGAARVYELAAKEPGDPNSTGEAGKLLSVLKGERGPIYAVAYRPDGKLVATAGFDGIVRLNDPDTGNLIREFLPVPLATAAK